jgi:flagellar capping protein FliD
MAQTMQLSSISSLQSQVSSLQTQLSSANAVQLQQLNQISSLESQLSTASSQYSSLQAQASSLQGNITQLREIAGLQLQTKWWDQRMVSVKANSCNRTTFTNVPYAGYIEIDFLSTSAAPLTAGLSWSAYGMTYSPTNTVIAPGSMSFIILPTSLTTLSLCDISTFTPTTVIVTVIYHY